MASPLTPSPVLSFVNGPALTDGGLSAWLGEQQSRGSTLRLPVVVDFGGPYRLGVARAWLGSDTANPGATLLDLDDAAMSVSLLDHLRRSCPEGERCAIWVEARWGAPVPMPTAMAAFAEGPATSAVTVLRFAGLAAEPATHVQVSR